MIFDIVLIITFGFVLITMSVLIFRMFRENEDNKKYYEYANRRKIKWWPVDKRCKCEYCKSDGELDDKKISDNEYLDIWTYHNICMSALYGE